MKLKAGELTKDEIFKYIEAIDPVANSPFYIDDTAAISTTELRAKCKRLKLEKGLGLVVIDYLQLMSGNNKESRQNEIADISRSLKLLAKELGVSEQVHLLGTMTPEQVREEMEKHQLFLFTSDQNEGWGAVLNEAMNSGCAVVASDAVGSVPYLLCHGQNGIVYHSGDVEALSAKVQLLLSDPKKCRTLGVKAYETMIQSWNAEIAAQRLTELTRQLLDGTKSLKLYDAGPCSKA